MRFGVREVCNVVLKAKSAQRVGKKIFYKNEPVMYFDTLKTSSLEGQSSTVYAQGGRGNPRLVAWEGERTVTFVMEDALISPEGLSILTGAGLVAASSESNGKTIYQHVTEIIDVDSLNFINEEKFKKENNKWIRVYDNVVVYEKETIEGQDEPSWIKKAESILPNDRNLDLENFITVENGDKYKMFKQGVISIPLSHEPYLPVDKNENFAYVMFMKDGEVITEPYIPVHGKYNEISNPFGYKALENTIPIKYEITIKDHINNIIPNSYADLTPGATVIDKHNYVPGENTGADGEPDIIKGEVPFNSSSYDVREFPFTVNNGEVILNFDSVFVDYYREVTAGATQIEITADKFGGNYYLEAETLFRTQDGLDLPANFIIPNCKVQSNFNFAMSNTGDPSTFTFTMDAFPDYTRFDHTHKVFAAIQIIEDIEKEDLHRHSTGHEPAHDDLDWY